MIELRKRVLSSGFVVLESRCWSNWSPNPARPEWAWGEWKPVPYVDENGEPLNQSTVEERASG